MNFLSTSHETVASDRSLAHAVSCRLRLQFPFVFRQLHSLQMLGLARPFPFRFVSSASLQFSGLPLSRPFVVSASLSDPRCFRFLSSASVLGSDYSASVLLFSFLFGSASQWLSRCSFASFVAQVFPLSFRLISHPVCPILLTQLCCSFPFALPCFAPTAASQVLVFFPVSFVPLFLTSVLPCLMLSFVRFRLSGSGYSAFSLFRSASSQTHLAPALVWCPPLLSSLWFPRLPSAGFPSALFPFLLTWFSAPFLFVLPNFAPAAVPLVLAFVFCFVSSASSLGICPLLPFPFGPFRFRL